MKVFTRQITLNWVYCFPKCPFYHSGFLPTKESLVKLLDLEIPGELPIFVLVGRITNLLHSFTNAFQSQKAIDHNYFRLFYVFEQMSKSFKLLSLQDFYCRRFKTWSKLEEWGMLRANEPCDLINPALPPNPPKVQRHFTLLFVHTTSPLKSLNKCKRIHSNEPIWEAHRQTSQPPKFIDILLCILQAPPHQSPHLRLCYINFNLKYTTSKLDQF